MLIQFATQQKHTIPIPKSHCPLGWLMASHDGTSTSTPTPGPSSWLALDGNAVMFGSLGFWSYTAPPVRGNDFSFTDPLVVPWFFEDSGGTCSRWWTRGDFSDLMNIDNIFLYSIYIFIYKCMHILYTFEGIDIIPHLQIESPIVEGEKSFCKAPFLSPVASFPPESLPSFIRWFISPQRRIPGGPSLWLSCVPPRSWLSEPECLPSAALAPESNRENGGAKPLGMLMNDVQPLCGDRFWGAGIDWRTPTARQLRGWEGGAI